MLTWNCPKKVAVRVRTRVKLEALLVVERSRYRKTYPCSFPVLFVYVKKSFVQRSRYLVSLAQSEPLNLRFILVMVWIIVIIQL